MSSIDGNTLAAIGLLMVLVIGFGHANGWLSPLEGDVDQEMYIRGEYPKVGDVFEVVYRIKLKEKNRLDEYPKQMVKLGYVVLFGARSFDPVILLSDKEIFVPVLNPGEWREFSIQLKITKSAENIRILAATHFKVSKAGATINMPLYLIDPETGQYGTKEEYKGKLPVEYRYDPVDGSFTCSPSQNPAPVEENRRIIKMIRQFEPALSDSEALLLHSDQYRIGVPEGMPRWDEENERWIEEETFEYYLRDGWYDALREGRRKAWIQDEKSKVENKRKGGSLNFFRPDNGRNYGGSYRLDRFEKNFYGWWWYKDHDYNKNQGLLAAAVKRPIDNGKARLLMTYMYNSIFYRTLSDYAVTDDSGYFCITFDIPQGATGCKAYPIIYPSGPDPSSPKINVSDPNITLPDYWKDTDDQTLFIMRELGVPTYHEFYANAIPCTLGVIWTDTFPQVSQPQSGCINIYETYLHARTFMSPPPTRPL